MIDTTFGAIEDAKDEFDWIASNEERSFNTIDKAFAISSLEYAIREEAAKERSVNA